MGLCHVWGGRGLVVRNHLEDTGTFERVVSMDLKKSRTVWDRFN
jgi:hypothetical protein